MQPEKLCPNCNEIQPPEGFSKNRSRPDGLSWMCRKCTAEYKRKYALREKTVPHEKKCHSCKVVKDAAEFYMSSSSKDGLHHCCKTCNSRISREYYSSDAGRERFKKWYKKYKESGAYHKNVKRNDERRRNNPSFVISKRTRSRIAHALKHGFVSKKWRDHLPFTFDDLVSHIERQFVRGMSWERLFAGEVHIDHVVPVSDFKITSIGCPEFRACWSLGNLRPVWAKDNLCKSNKRLFLV